MTALGIMFYELHLMHYSYAPELLLYVRAGNGYYLIRINSHISFKIGFIGLGKRLVQSIGK